MSSGIETHVRVHSQEALDGEHKEIVRMNNEGFLEWVPPESTHTELNNCEFLDGVFDFQVPDVGPVELERVTPWSASDPGHFKVYRHEISGSYMISEVFKR
jgi:hypothetical protein